MRPDCRSVEQELKISQSELRMDSSAHATGNYALSNPPMKSKRIDKKPPAPPPRKSSVPHSPNDGDQSSSRSASRKTTSQSADRVPVIIDGKLMSPPVPPSDKPAPPKKATGAENQGLQFDIHGDTTGKPMIPIPISTPQPPQKSPKEGDELTRKTSASITLKDLADYHFPKFPLRVQILEGYMSNHVPHLTLSTADIYNIHLLKRQEVVVARDCLGHSYNIPLNTSIQFGLLPSRELLQAHDKNAQESSFVLSYSKVSDIVAVKVLPKVICATRTLTGKDGDQATVEAGEILVVGKTSKHKKKKVLEVFSVTEKAQKMLPYDFAGRFTTSPRRVAMYLPDLLQHVLDVLPCDVRLFFSEDGDIENKFSSTSLNKGVITLTEKKVETSLVASTVIEDTEFDLDCEESLLDIPLDENLSQIEVAIVPSSNTVSRKRLRTATQNILKNVNLSKLRSYRDAASDNVYETQTMLYSAHRVENDRLGVEFETPIAVRESTSTLTGAPEIEPYDNLPQPREEIDHDQVYETIPARTSTVADDSAHLTDHNRSNASVSDEDSVFTSSRASMMSNLDMHPRAQIIREGFYQAPRPHQTNNTVDYYDIIPPRHSFAKSASSSAVPRLSSSTSMQHLPGERPPSDHSEQRLGADRTSGSLDNLLEEIHSLRNSKFLQSDISHNEAPSHNSQSIANLTQQIKSLHKQNELLTERVISLEQTNLEGVINRIELLEKEVKRLQGRLSGKAEDTVKPVDKINDQRKRNREVLEKATVDEVLQILDGMGLHQYKTVFSQEHIDGAVLLELDAEVLKCELGIKSKLHCVRLAKIISGEDSAQQFLNV